MAKKEIKTDAELAEALNEHSIAFAYHSGKIENDDVTYNDIREIFDHDGVTSYSGDLRNLFEIQNAKRANELFFVSFNEKREINENLVLIFPKELTMSTYDALEAFDNALELDTLCTFLKHQTIKTWKKRAIK